MRVLIISIIVVITDQVSKLLVKGFTLPFTGYKWHGMNYGESINVIGELFKFTYVENPGMAFGINVDGYAKFFLSLFSLVASVAIIVYLYKHRKQKFLFRAALALILGGAIGNLIDRFFYGVLFDYAPLLYGRVVDFLHFDALGFTLFGKTFDSFPIFNVADSAVTIGVGILLIFHNSFEESNSNEKKEAENISDELANAGSNREENKSQNN